MSEPWRYTALIRTDHVSELLKQTVIALRAQAMPPTEILFVDSSGKAEVAVALGELGGRVVTYPKDQPFNFAKAINVGVAQASEPYVLVVSSHVHLGEPTLVQDGVSEMLAKGLEVVYWCAVPETHRHQRKAESTTISPQDFNGRNGLSNSCAMLPRERMREIEFREEVFSAEDQAWAATYFQRQRRSILRIEHPQLVYANPNVNARKTINEEIAIAYFAYRRGLWPDQIVARALRALLAAVRGRPDRASMHWHIAKGLFMAWFKAPRAQSKYY